MSYYLQMDGVDDRFATPNMEFDFVEIDALFILGEGRKNPAWLKGDIFQFNTYTSSAVQTIFINDVDVTSNYNLPDSERVKLSVSFKDSTSSYVQLFINGWSNAVEGNLYSVKMYKNNILVAHYDMSTGTLIDQTGNNSDATTRGGTWVQEEGGGTETEPISHTLSLSDSITTNDTITKHFSIITNDSILTIEHIMKQLQRNISDSIDLNDSFSNFGGKSVLLTDSINITDSISITKRLSRFLSESVSLSDELNKSSSQNIVIYDAIITNDNIDLFNPNAPSLIGVIHLKGKRDLFVYLQGKRELAIFLKGGLNMVSNQNFNMVSGDTKTILINIEEDLLGADVRWALFKRGESVETLIKSGNIIDGQINITLNKDDTEGLKGIYSHECEVTDQNGNVSTVTTGIVTIINDMI